MAKGPVITEKVRRIIAEVYLQHRDWRAKEIQNEVDKRLNGNGPGLSAVQKILTRMREKEEQILNQGANLDAPWSLGSLGMKPEYELPPGIIPLVLDLKRAREVDIKLYDPNRLISRVKRKFKPEDQEMLRGEFAKVEKRQRHLPYFSLREARWVARISNVLSGRVSAAEIGWWAFLYADFEKACELAGVTCDTSELDSALSLGDLHGYTSWVLLRKLPGHAQGEAEYIEAFLFGQTLDYFKLSALSWDLYCTWLNCIVNNSKKWLSLSGDEQKDLVKRLRIWAGEQEQVEELRRPDQLLEEVQYVSPIGEAYGNHNTWTSKEAK
jgi:hypothetical protein